MNRNYTTLAGLLLFALCLAAAAQSPVQFGFGSTDLAPVKFGGKKLPSWLTSDYSPIFNGVNQYAVASIPSLPFGSSPRTMMFWVKPYNNSNTNSTAIMYGPPGGSNVSKVRINSLNQNIDFCVGSNVSRYYVTTPVPIGQWTHVTIAYSGNGHNLTGTDIYKNGSRISGSIEANASVTTGLGDFLVSSEQNLTARNFSVAEASIWNRALTQNEILRYKDKRLKGTEAGLVAYYPLNEPPGSTVFVDKVGGKNAVGSNSIQITRRNGYSAPDVRSERYCLSFDGVDDYASGTNTAITGYPFSYDGWVQPTMITDGSYCNMFVIASSTTNGKSVNARLKRSAGQVVIQLIVNGVTRYDATSTARIGEWGHFAFSAESAASAAFFLNGSLVSASANPVAAWEKSGRVEINSLTGSSIGKGKHANVRFWTKALSQPEIASLMYQTSTGNEANLVGNFKMIEGSGAVATNSVSVNPGSMTINLISGPTYVGRDIP